MAARLPGGGISETAVNAAIAFVEGAKPRDEIEAALVIQMACAHSAAMAVLRRLGGAHGGDRCVVAMATAASRLLRAYAVQVETLRRLRNGAFQVVRVEHIHVNEGGQAIVGAVAGVAVAHESQSVSPKATLREKDDDEAAHQLAVSRRTLGRRPS
jgi:hypothetical protein